MVSRLETFVRLFSWRSNLDRLSSLRANGLFADPWTIIGWSIGSIGFRSNVLVVRFRCPLHDIPYHQSHRSYWKNEECQYEVGETRQPEKPYPYSGIEIGQQGYDAHERIQNDL